MSLKDERVQGLMDAEIILFSIAFPLRAEDMLEYKERKIVFRAREYVLNQLRETGYTIERTH